MSSNRDNSVLRQMTGLIAVSAVDAHDSQIPPEERALFEAALSSEPKRCRIETVQGFFSQSDNSTDDLVFDSLACHFGLQKPSWTALEQEIRQLNDQAPEGTKYKLLFCARHGQGYHNKLVDIVGIEEWDRHWSHLNEGDFDGEHLVWGPDPFLTSRGEEQARLMHRAFSSEISHGLPLPTKLFSSPFTRSAQTLLLTWNDILVSQDPAKRVLQPLVKENLRETIGEHTCDKRSSKSEFLKRFPHWGFVHDSDFPEEDIYYKDDWREPIHEQALRAFRFLQEVYQHDDEIIYCSSHSGEIKALLLASNHRPFAVPTAGMIPIVIKMTKEETAAA